jgi:hypothetical protein
MTHHLSAAAIEARLAELEAKLARLQKVEDHLAIYQLMSGYGYAVDGLNAGFIEAMYAPNGVYEVPGMLKYESAAEVATVTRDEGTLAYVKSGAAHTVPLPYVVIEGDRATATSYHIIIRKGAFGGDHHQIARASACRWDFSRKPDGSGWQVDYRKNIPLDGSPEGPALLARLAEGPAVADV